MSDNQAQIDFLKHHIGEQGVTTLAYAELLEKVCAAMLDYKYNAEPGKWQEPDEDDARRCEEEGAAQRKLANDYWDAYKQAQLEAQNDPELWKPTAEDIANDKGGLFTADGVFRLGGRILDEPDKKLLPDIHLQSPNVAMFNIIARDKIPEGYAVAITEDGIAKMIPFTPAPTSFRNPIEPVKATYEVITKDWQIVNVEYDKRPPHERFGKIEMLIPTGMIKDKDGKDIPAVQFDLRESDNVPPNAIVAVQKCANPDCKNMIPAGTTMRYCDICLL